MTPQELMHQANLNGAVLDYEVVGSGEPVVLIHGALLAEAYAPLCAEPALTAHARLVRYHQRGYAGSSRVAAPFSIAQQAADCLALLRHLGIERAHVVGHSSGGIMALRLALDAPEVVHSLILLEPALMDVASGAMIGPFYRGGCGKRRRNGLAWSRSRYLAAIALTFRAQSKSPTSSTRCSSRAGNRGD